MSSKYPIPEPGRDSGIKFKSLKDLEEYTQFLIEEGYRWASGNNFIDTPPIGYAKDNGLKRWHLHRAPHGFYWSTEDHRLVRSKTIMFESRKYFSISKLYKET